MWNMELLYIFIHLFTTPPHQTTSNISTKIITTNPLITRINRPFTPPYNYHQPPLYKYCIYNNIHSNNYQQHTSTIQPTCIHSTITYHIRVSSDQSYQGFKHPNRINSLSSLITHHHHLSTTIHHYYSSSLITSHINVYAYIHHHYHIHITCIVVCYYTTT